MVLSFNALKKSEVYYKLGQHHIGAQSKLKNLLIKKPWNATHTTRAPSPPVMLGGGLRSHMEFAASAQEHIQVHIQILGFNPFPYLRFIKPQTPKSMEKFTFWPFLLLFVPPFSFFNKFF